MYKSPIKYYNLSKGTFKGFTISTPFICESEGIDWMALVLCECWKVGGWCE